MIVLDAAGGTQILAPARKNVHTKPDLKGSAQALERLDSERVCTIMVRHGCATMNHAATWMRKHNYHNIRYMYVANRKAQRHTSCRTELHTATRQEFAVDNMLS